MPPADTDRHLRRKEIEGRNKKQRGQAMDEIKSIVAKYGIKLEEVISQSATRKPRKAAVKKRPKRMRPAAPP